MKSLLSLCLMVAVFLLSCNKDKDFPEPQSPIYELEYLELGKVKLSFSKLDLLNSNIMIGWGDGVASRLTTKQVIYEYPYNSYFTITIYSKNNNDSLFRLNSSELLKVSTCKTKIAILTKKLNKDDSFVLSLGSLDNSTKDSIGLITSNYQRSQLPNWDMKSDKDVLIVELDTRKKYQVYSQRKGEVDKLEKEILTQDNLSFQTIEL